MFEQYSLGKGFRTIQSQLNDKGIHSINGTIFSLSTLKRMISNEKYKGLLVSGKTRNDFETKSLRVTTPEERTYINNGIPAIVDEGLWEKCNQIRKNRVRKYDKNKPNEVFTGYFNGSYPLSNKIFCGKCGESYWHGVYYQAVSKQKVDQWQCRNYKAYGKTHKLGCDGVKLQDKEIMDCLRKVISELSQNKSAYNSNMEYIISLLTKQLKESQSNNQLEKLNQDVTKITNRKDRLMDMLLDGLITKEEFQSKKESLECDLIKIKSEIDEYNKLDYTYQSKANRIEEIRKLLSVSFTKAENISGQVVEEMINKVIILEADKKLVVILNSGSSSANIVGKIDIDKVISSVIVIFNTQCELRKPRCTKTKEIWSVDIGFTV